MFLCGFVVRLPPTDPAPLRRQGRVAVGGVVREAHAVREAEVQVLRAQRGQRVEVRAPLGAEPPRDPRDGDTQGRGIFGCFCNLPEVQKSREALPRIF